MAEINVHDTRSHDETDKRPARSRSSQYEGSQLAMPEEVISSRKIQSLENQTREDVSSGDMNEPNLRFMMDLTLPFSVELGRVDLTLQEILNLKPGQVIELKKLSTEPVDIIVNGKKMGEGELVIIEDHFGVRITQIGDPSENSQQRRK